MRLATRLRWYDVTKVRYPRMRWIRRRKQCPDDRTDTPSWCTCRRQTGSSTGRYHTADTSWTHLLARTSLFYEHKTRVYLQRRLVSTAVSTSAGCRNNNPYPLFPLFAVRALHPYPISGTGIPTRIATLTLTPTLTINLVTLGLSNPINPSCNSKTTKTRLYSTNCAPYQIVLF